MLGPGGAVFYLVSRAFCGSIGGFCSDSAFLVSPVLSLFSVPYSRACFPQILSTK